MFVQDSLVVCRLRKNSEFRASSNQSHSSTLPNSNGAVSEAGIDHVGLSAVGSSHDSYSSEQIDSTSESKQKLSNEVTLGETSSQQKVGCIVGQLRFSTQQGSQQLV